MTDTEKATMTDIEKATLYRGLAESARLRFESRRDVEWKVGIAIWSALGVSAGIVASARVWSPDFIDAVLGSLLAVLVCCLFAFAWLPYLSKTGQKELRQSYYWESHIRKLIDPQLTFPIVLEPHPNDGGVKTPWPNAYQQYSSRLDDGVEPPLTAEIKVQWHRAMVVQVMITILLALLFVGALWSRYRFAAKPANSSNFSISGESLSIEGIKSVEASK